MVKGAKILLLGVMLASVVLIGVAPTAAEARKASWSDVSHAKAYARWYWEDYRGLTIPCYGVAIQWDYLSSDTLGGTTGRCIVHMNRREPGWSWYKLCWTMIHEYGHIVGYGHTWKPNAIMRRAWNNSHDWACT